MKKGGWDMTVFVQILGQICPEKAMAATGLLPGTAGAVAEEGSHSSGGGGGDGDESATGS